MHCPSLQLIHQSLAYLDGCGQVGDAIFDQSSGSSLFVECRHATLWELRVGSMYI